MKQKQRKKSKQKNKKNVNKIFEKYFKCRIRRSRNKIFVWISLKLILIMLIPNLRLLEIASDASLKDWDVYFQ